MDQALGEQHAGVVGQACFDLRVRPDDGRRRADDVAETAVVLEQQRADQAALDDGEEFVGPRVPVGRVQAAGVDEADGLREAGGTERGEVVDGGEQDGAAGRGRDGVVDKLERVVGGVGRVGEEDGFACRLGLCEEEGVALGGELCWREDVDGVRVDVAFGEGVERLEAGVDVGFAG